MEDDPEDEHKRNEPRMVTQRTVLAFIGEHRGTGRGVNAQDLSGEFRLFLSLEAAGGHLKRLWRERLIETTSARPLRYRFRLESGEPILQLRFKLTARGRARLGWYKRHDDDQGWLPILR
jgi:hypothetical protein